MSDDRFRLNLGVFEQLARDSVAQINANADRAADDDKAGRWGLDGWIRTIHDLIDLQVRTYAAVLNVAVSGPWWNQPTDTKPAASEPITVPHPEFARTLTGTGFTRLGVPGEAIPDHCVDLVPDILAAGQTEVRVALTDSRYVGANYRGTIVWKRTGSPAETGELEVIVGL